MKYPEYKQLDLPLIAKEVLKEWEEKKIFEKSILSKEGAPSFVFYEGPPSANGLPGIHHVMSRTIKDLFCRYHTMAGKQVKRKAGWDTHGLPIELSVEKTLGITKEDIGKKITIEEYNKACRREVMKYKDVWDDLTKRIGFWVDLSDPYITFDNKYIESVWWLLKNLYDKDLLYKGYTIQPYSPAAGTGLSSHELNQPGCYKNVKDTTVTAMFKVKKDSRSEKIINFSQGGDVYFLAWTTTPWTLPSNTALAVGKNIEYCQIQTYNAYTHQLINVILAKELFGKYFSKQNQDLAIGNYKPADKNIPYKIITQYAGVDLEGIHYEQLLPYAQPKDGDAFRVVCGDFVSTEDGTGIVHLAPSFGADDFRTAKQNGIGSLTLVDKQGRFTAEVKDPQFPLTGKYVKEAYLADAEKASDLKEQQEKLKPIIPKLDKYLSVDELITLKLKIENKAFRIEKYEHNYPHCWRTDKPVLYYPLDSWFIRTTALKQKMVEKNNTIKWKPESTGTGRFGNWLENLVDWNLSRSRFWGIPLPVWVAEDKKEKICIGSVKELHDEIEKSVKAGFMKSNPLSNFSDYNSFDLHRPYADDIFLVSVSGKKMLRESDLIDVWFDSGSMPYAQWHYPFENKLMIEGSPPPGKGGTAFPADFIAEGVDQTRGWFFTLHAIAVMCFDSVAFKTVVSNGLVLDKNGNKMSKRLGNAVDPFETIDKFGPDATRWYMVTNAPPWDNLKFDLEGIKESQRKFFGTLYNTYAFFALYANIDGFTHSENEIPLLQRPEIDRWIISELNTLVKDVKSFYEDYEPHSAGRAVEDFVDNLSNWYVRLCRRRFWKSENSADKLAAYQTLYSCLNTVAKLSAPIAPFFMDRLFNDLNRVTGKIKAESVHLADFPVAEDSAINHSLQLKMKYARQVSSLVLSIRKKENIRVRQPLGMIRVAVLSENTKKHIEAVKDLILAEVNVKALEFVDGASAKLVKKLKLKFPVLGKKYAKLMKPIQAFAVSNEEAVIASLEQKGASVFTVENETVTLLPEDVEIIPVDIPGWKIANERDVTVALDVTITGPLKEEGIARELINRIQNLRKEKEFEVTDKIILKIQKHDSINSAVSNNLNYICAETLASSLELVSTMDQRDAAEVDVDENTKIFLTINKHSNGKEN